VSDNAEPAARGRQDAQARGLRQLGLPATAENSQTRSQGGATPEKMEPAQAATIILDRLKVCEPVLAELRAASLRRYCRFNVPYEDWAGPTKSNAYILTAHHYVVIKWLDRVLSLRAEAELAAGQGGQALEDVNLMFRLDDGLKDEPLLISQLVRYASLSILLQPVAQGLAEHRWSDAQLRALQERLGQTDLLASTVRSFYGERDLCDNPFFNESVMKLRGWDRLEQVNVNRAFQEVLLPRIDLADREINPVVGHTCDLATSNYLVGPTVLQRVRAILLHHILAAMMAPSLGHVTEKTAATQTDVDLVTVACALERYRLAEGTYPDQLEALTPRFIATLPHDIINGQPLKYRRTANGKFVLYSVGWNGKDDGGVTATDKEGRLDRQRGDWVLEYPD
jgi:Tfp pilus assembly protein PilE